MRGRKLAVATVLLLAVVVPGALTVAWVRGAFDGRAGHYPATDPDDPVARGVREAHVALNGAVGWDEWRPEHLRGLARRLTALAARYGDDGRSAARSQLLEAAAAIEDAVRDGERAEAVFAHRLIEQLEHRLAADYQRRIDEGDAR